MTFIKISKSHFVIESETQTLQTYDLKKNEFGCFECTCQGYAYRHDCKHVRMLYRELEQSVVTSGSTDKVALSPVAKSLLAGVGLEQLFDYAELAPKQSFRTA